MSAALKAEAYRRLMDGDTLDRREEIHQIILDNPGHPMTKILMRGIEYESAIQALLWGAAERRSIRETKPVRTTDKTKQKELF